jgi:hypothetical protein
MKEILNNLNACDEAMEWAKTVNYDWPRIYNECERGDWLLWLHNRTNKTDFKQRTLVKGLVSKTVEHIMKDQRSKDAVKAAIDFGNGLISVKELAHTEMLNAAAAAYAADAYAAAAAYMLLLLLMLLMLLMLMLMLLLLLMLLLMLLMLMLKNKN